MEPSGCENETAAGLFFPEVSVDVIKPEKNTLTYYSLCMGASNKSLFLANFRMHRIMVKMH